MGDAMVALMHLGSSPQLTGTTTWGYCEDVMQVKPPYTVLYTEAEAPGTPTGRRAGGEGTQTTDKAGGMGGKGARQPRRIRRVCFEVTAINMP